MDARINGHDGERGSAFQFVMAGASLKAGLPDRAIINSQVGEGRRDAIHDLCCNVEDVDARHKPGGKKGSAFQFVMAGLVAQVGLPDLCLII